MTRRRISAEAAAPCPASGNDAKGLRMVFPNKKETSVIEPQ